MNKRSNGKRKNLLSITNNALQLKRYHPLLRFALLRVKLSYDPSCWTCIGPKLVTKASHQEICLYRQFRSSVRPEAGRYQGYQENFQESAVQLCRDEKDYDGRFPGVQRSPLSNQTLKFLAVEDAVLGLGSSPLLLPHVGDDQSLRRPPLQCLCCAGTTLLPDSVLFNQKLLNSTLHLVPLCIVPDRSVHRKIIKHFRYIGPFFFIISQFILLNSLRYLFKSNAREF